MEITIQETIEVPDGLLSPPADLLETDGEPLESPWHRSAINLLIDVVLWFFRGRTDFFVGGNMFIYYSERAARTREYRGPDFFFVKGVDGTRQRRYWYLPAEGGRYPDVIIELLSPKTAKADRTTKKTLYEQTFRTPEYYCYDPDTKQLEGWRHDGQGYQALTPNERGWIWCEQLRLWLGTWEGDFQNQHATWPRFYDQQGQLIPIAAEAEAQRAEAAAQRAEAEAQRARAAEEQLTQLKAWLAQQKIVPPGIGSSVQG